MLSGVIEGGAAIIIAIAGGLIIFGQLKSNAERNAKDIDAIKVMMHEFQEDMKDLISKNLKDVKDLIDANKENQRDALNREITHIKDMISMTANETREDIKRLELRQDQANHLREKYATMAASLKALHHRLDLEPPALLEEEDR